MEAILPFIGEKDYKGLIETCEQLELKHSAGQSDIDLSDIDAPYLLGYCLINDLDSARFLRKRILARDNIRKQEVDFAWKICAALWDHQYSQVYNAFNAFPWSEPVQSLVASLQENTRERMLATVANAYTTINVADALYYFGMPENELVPVLQSKGWSYDTSSKILTPLKPELKAQDISSIDKFSSLADMILHLERT
ncbi:COP9 signalosome [Phycomyces nitens]|nr:COP9 signalosome [Phycomyces nitens]